jgi:hypothetical protein
MMKKKNALLDDKGIYVEYWPLSKILRHPRNPKLHDLDTLNDSFDRFGYVMPGMIDERTGILIAGHGRADKLQQRKDADQPAPERVIVNEQGEWCMPILRGVRFKDDTEAEAYLLADNQLTISGGWSNQTLFESLSAMKASVEGFKGLGFSEETLRALEATWGHTELVSFEAFVKPSPVVVKWRVVVPDLNEKQAKKIASQFKNAIVETYRE